MQSEVRIGVKQPHMKARLTEIKHHILPAPLQPKCKASSANHHASYPYNHKALRLTAL